MRLAHLTLPKFLRHTAALPLFLAPALAGCVILPLPEKAAEQVPFAIPLRIGGSAPAADAVMPVARCAPPAGAALQPDAILTEVNRQRAAKGLTPLQKSPRLGVVAQDQACEIAARQGTSHRDAAGRNLASRATAAGYGWRHIAENVGFGRVATAPEAVALWLQSAGHRANLLDPQAREAGFGYAETGAGQPGWALVLANPR